MKSVLVTGFGHFGGVKDNPSGALAKRANDWPFKSLDVVGHELPVEYSRGSVALGTLLMQRQWDAVISLGLLPGLSGIQFECTAIGLDSCSIPDNAGVVRTNQLIWIGDNYEEVYPTTLPVKQASQAISEAGISVSESHNAGGYLCNHIFYRVTHYAHKVRSPTIPAGFIHIPYAEDLSLSLQEKALQTVIKKIFF